MDSRLKTAGMTVHVLLQSALATGYFPLATYDLPLTFARIFAAS